MENWKSYPGIVTISRRELDLAALLHEARQKAEYYRDCYLDYWFQGDEESEQYKKTVAENVLPWELQPTKSDQA